MANIRGRFLRERWLWFTPEAGDPFSHAVFVLYGLQPEHVLLPLAAQAPPRRRRSAVRAEALQLDERGARRAGPLSFSPYSTVSPGICSYQEVGLSAWYSQTSKK